MLQEHLKSILLFILRTFFHSNEETLSKSYVLIWWSFSNRKLVNDNYSHVQRNGRMNDRKKWDASNCTSNIYVRQYLLRNIIFLEYLVFYFSQIVIFRHSYCEYVLYFNFMLYYYNNTRKWKEDWQNTYKQKWLFYPFDHFIYLETITIIFTWRYVQINNYTTTILYRPCTRINKVRAV